MFFFLVDADEATQGYDKKARRRGSKYFFRVLAGIPMEARLLEFGSSGHAEPFVCVPFFFFFDGKKEALVEGLREPSGIRSGARNLPATPSERERAFGVGLYLVVANKCFRRSEGGDGARYVGLRVFHGCKSSLQRSRTYFRSA